MQQLIIASNNAGKIKEFSNIFSQFNIQTIPQSELNIPEIDEPYQTFIENSLHKARNCSKHTGLPALADDSGLCVKSLNGAPGIYSARYAGDPKSDEKNINKLLNDLLYNSERQAYFYCSLVFIRNATDPQPVIAEGLWHGEITSVAQGHNGHGYDPVFWLPEYQQTVAELDSAIKNQISHRGKAIKELMTKLNQLSII